MSMVGELLVPGIVIVFGVIYYFSVAGLPQESTVFPYVLMVLMPILAVLILLQEYRRHRSGSESTAEAAKEEAVKAIEDIKAPALVYAASIGYLVIFYLSNFIVASFVFMAFVMIYFRIGLMKSLGISALFTVVMYVVFGKAFLVDL